MTAPHIAAAMGPEVAQAAAAAAAFHSTLYAGAVDMGRPPASTLDRRSPQTFQSRPNPLDAINTTAAGDDTTNQTLPGRLGPSEWDGEPGWMAAIGGGDA